MAALSLSGCFDAQAPRTLSKPSRPASRPALSHLAILTAMRLLQSGSLGLWDPGSACGWELDTARMTSSHVGRVDQRVCWMASIWSTTLRNMQLSLSLEAADLAVPFCPTPYARARDQPGGWGTSHPALAANKSRRPKNPPFSRIASFADEEAICVMTTIS